MEDILEWRELDFLIKNKLMITRRKALKTLGIASIATGSGLGWSSFSAAQSTAAAINPLRIPLEEAGSLSNNTRSFQLELQRGLSSFLPNTTTETIGINGSYLGPTLRFNRNEKVSLNVSNRLGEPSTLHWHGFHLPVRADGGPHNQIENGDSWNAEFDVVQFAGSFWYHSHMLHKSGEQVYHGLAGMIVVDDADQQVDLPSNYGVDDIPLVVQDRRFNDDGSFDYLSNYEDSVIGMHGDTILVNGTHRPYFVPTTRLVRFRILNASNARSYTFALSDGREFRQVASDGGLLQQPIALSSLELAPAERAEIVVDFQDRNEVKLVSLGKTAIYPEFPGGMSAMMRSLNAQTFDILELRPQRQLASSAELPAQLSSIYRLPEAAATNTRQFLLSMGNGMRSGDDRGPGSGLRNGRGGGFGGGHFSINGRNMAMDFINERIQMNTTEIWEIRNDSPMMHPFHVHNGQFQLLDRNGSPPPASEMGWKDTVKVQSGELVRIIMRFTDFRDEDTPYMYHCHILEHEDRGMMGQFTVV